MMYFVIAQLQYEWLCQDGKCRIVYLVTTALFQATSYILVASGTEHILSLWTMQIQEIRHVLTILTYKFLPASKRSLIGFLISNPFCTCRTASASLKEI